MGKGYGLGLGNLQKCQVRSGGGAGPENQVEFLDGAHLPKIGPPVHGTATSRRDGLPQLQIFKTHREILAIDIAETACKVFDTWGTDGRPGGGAGFGNRWM
jgi:hypothetical protein